MIHKFLFSKENYGDVKKHIGGRILQTGLFNREFNFKGG